MNLQKLTLREYMMLSILCLVGGTVLENISTHVGYHAWLLYLISVTLALFCFMMLYRLMYLHDFRSLPQILESCLGFWGGKIMTMVYGFFFLFRTKVAGDGLTKMATDLLMVRAPARLVMSVLLFACVYATYKGLRALGRSAEFMLPLLIVGLIPFIISSFFTHKPPVAQMNPRLVVSWGEFWRNTLTVTIYPYTETLLFFLFVVKVQRNQRRKYFSHLLISSSIATVLLIFMTMGTVFLLGVHPTRELRYPFYSAMQLVQLSGVVDRFDAMAVIIIIISVFYKVALYLYAWTDMVIMTFPKISRKMVLAITAVLIFSQGPTAAMTETPFLADILPFKILPWFHFVIPMILWLITEIKHRKFMQQKNPEATV